MIIHVRSEEKHNISLCGLKEKRINLTNQPDTNILYFLNTIIFGVIMSADKKICSECAKTKEYGLYLLAKIA